MYGYGYGAPTSAGYSYGYGAPRGYGAPPYTKQPMPYGMGMPPPVPRDRYMEQYPPEPPNTGMLCGMGIFVLLCCFWPLGIAALVCASASSSAYYEGRVEEAHQCGRYSMWASFAGIALGVIGLVVLFVLLYAV